MKKLEKRPPAELKSSNVTIDLRSQKKIEKAIKKWRARAQILERNNRSRDARTLRHLRILATLADPTRTLPSRAHPQEYGSC